MLDLGLLAADVQEFLYQAAPGIPPQLYWMAPLIFITLAIAAIIDAVTSRVPDPLIFFGAVMVTGGLGFCVSWPHAALNLIYGIAAGMVVWTLNEIWYRLRKEDAIGMGDAKWTLLAVLCFGWQPMLIGWGAGAIIAVIVMETLRIIGRPLTRVHFAPFLLAGLAIGVWWVRF